MGLKNILAAEGVTPGRQVSFSVEVLEEGTYPAAPPHKKSASWRRVRLSGPRRSIEATLTKRGRTVCWDWDEDDNMPDRDQWLARLVSSVAFK